MSTQFPNSPYFDDFSPSKDFYKVLFRPGVALQTRELNQMQSILQAQTESLSNHLFKDGAMIIPGYIAQDIKCDCIKLETINSVGEKISLFLTDFIDTTITGAVSGAKALVIHSETEVGTDKNTLYIKYIKSGDTSATFIDSEAIANDASIPLTCTTIASSSVDVGSLATIQNGIYYIKGYFVTVAKETIVLDKYDVTPSYRIGLNIKEDIIAPDDDYTLNDNAIGTYNYFAPGAHRYKISTNLVKLPLDSTLDSTFLELLRVNLGVVENKVVRTDYSIIEETLARRTYDESGDYTVSPFIMQVKQDRNNDRGVRVNNTAYIIGDIIEYTTGGSTYTYECIVAGTSASGTPAYIYTFGMFADGGVTWSYTENPVYNLGVNIPPLGYESKFDIAINGGKAYVKGHEIEKIATSNVIIDKPRDFDRVNNGNLTVNAGNFIRINNIHSIPEIPFITVSLYDRFNATPGTAAGTLVGTAMVGGIENDGVISTTYKLFLFNIILVAGKTFDANVRGLFYNNTTLAENFTANVYQTNALLTGSISTSTTSGTGVGTRFTSELVAGNYITMNGSTYYCIASITNDLALVLETSAGTITGSALYKGTSTTYEPTGIAATIPFNNSYIRNVKSADDTTSDTNYVITRNFQAETSSGAGVIIITLTVSGETFASSANATNYLFINNANGIVQAATVVISGAGKIMTATTGVASVIAYNVTAAITKTAAQRSKTLTLTTIDKIAAVTAQKSIITLAKADCYKLISVKLAPAFGTITTGGANDATIDITNNFNFDNGQRNTHYDVGSISLKAGYFPSNGSIRIVFEYFAHGTGDYFSVDSYASVIQYSDISSTLRDSLDFRPIMNDGGTAFDTTNTGILKRGYDISADYSYYLYRIDLLSIDILGNFFITRGIPSLMPKIPNLDKQSMNIATIKMFPYGIGLDASSIILNIVDNKRYTMRDIGALEKRINTLEYYTSLSMLEQETKSLSIPDEFGLDRYKNGFIVDAFNDHGVGAMDSLDYSCSIDMDNKILRPEFNVRNVDLLEYNTTDNQRTSNNYTITGDLITLPYTNSPLISQIFASRAINVNPFSIFTFIGNTKFIPASDNWFENVYSNDIIINKEGNYASTVSLLTQQNVLGTVWNAWQTNWTGSVKTVTGHSYYYPNGYDAAAWITEYAKVATTNIQNRTGISTQVLASYDTKEVNDKLVSTSIIPFMRPINISFLTRGLKPNSMFYPFFDSISVLSQISAATRLEISAITGYNINFDSATNSGGVATETARLTSNTYDKSLTNGDIVTGLTSGSTGVVVLTETTDTGIINLYIVNIIGTFLTNENILGSISGARANITSIYIAPSNSALISNSNGDIAGIFSVPNNDRMKFKTGDIEFRLTTQLNNDAAWTSIAKSTFSSNGILNTRQRTIESVRNSTINQTNVAENQTLVENTTTIRAYWDPLAQTFMVDSKGGAFLTKVDIFFASKDYIIPVKMQIREVVNGFPSAIILPFSEVILTPDKVNLSTTTVTDPNGTLYYKDDIATQFIFESPVYVKDGTEYCIVITSDSGKYNAWISHLGDKQISSDRYISKQPYLGVLFESQNGSTWVPNELEDLKFVIYRAVFTKNIESNIKFVNTILGADLLTYSPLQTTAGSKVVRIYHYSHGMIANDSVTISGIVAGTYNNIPSVELNGTHIIANIDIDSYTITTTTTSANVTGFTGGDGIMVTFNAKYDSIQPSIQALEFPEAIISYDIKTTSILSALDSAASNISNGDTFNMNSSGIVASQINETTNMSGAKSLVISARMLTTNDSISPVIDSQRKSAICITNRITDPTVALNIGVIDYRVLHSGASNLIDTVADATGYYYTTADAGLKLIFTSVVAGKYITVTNCTTSGNNGVKLVTSVASDGSYIKIASAITNADVSTTIAISVADYFVDEITPINSSCVAKYVSKIVSLENQSTSLNIRFAYTKPIEANIDVYYRIGSSSAIDAINKSIYTLVTNDGLVSTSDTKSYTDATYMLTGLPAYTAVQIKLVMRSSNTSKVPKMKDLRLIALA